MFSCLFIEFGVGGKKWDQSFSVLEFFRKITFLQSSIHKTTFSFFSRKLEIMNESTDKNLACEIGTVLWFSIHWVYPLPSLLSSGGMNSAVASVLHPLCKNFTLWLRNMLLCKLFWQYLAAKFWQIITTTGEKEGILRTETDTLLNSEVL